MSKRNIGYVLIVVGLLLFLRHAPFDLDFLPYKDMLWPLALAGFGFYLISRKNFQAGLVIFYIGLSYSLYYAGWKPIRSFLFSDYYLATVIIVLGLGFLLQSGKNK